MRGERQAGKAITRASVAATPLNAMDPELARLGGGSLQSFLEAGHPDPFALLGAHAVAGGVVLRALLPGAQAVAVLDIDGRPLLELQPQDDSPLFIGALPARSLPLRYRLHVRWDGGGETRFDDAYRFGPLIEDLDVWLLAEGSHHRLGLINMNN